MIFSGSKSSLASEADIERARAGLTIAYTYSHPEVQFTPELRAAWSQLLNDVPSELHGSFVDGSVPFILTEAPIAHDEVSSPKRMKALCSSMKSQNFRWACRPSCCESWKNDACGR